MMKLKIDLPQGFLDPEDRDGYTVTRETKELWAIQLDMLMELDRICRKHGLKYFVDSGTLLGAVRHKGYIPWDDDIDVILMRADYDKLLQVAQDEFMHPYFFQTAYTDKGYVRCHAQIRNVETTAMIASEAQKVPFNQGIFLDIFPVDNTSKLYVFNRLKCKFVDIYRRIFSYMYTEEVPAERRYKLLWGIAAKNKKDPVRLYKGFDRLAHLLVFKDSHVDKVTFYRYYHKYRHLEEDWFSKVVYMPFEFLRVPVPVGYDEILKRYYGENYMTPKMNKAIHQLFGGLIINTEEPYTKVLEKMRNK